MKKPETIYLKDYTPPNHIVDQIDLTFDLFEDKTTVTSIMKVKRNMDITDNDAPLIFDKADYKITSVIANGMVLLPDEYESDKEAFKLNRTPDIFELEITCEIKPHENTSLEGLYKSGDIFCTQCEAQGFIRYFVSHRPYVFNDPPDRWDGEQCSRLRRRFPGCHRSSPTSRLRSPRTRYLMLLLITACSQTPFRRS